MNAPRMTPIRPLDLDALRERFRHATPFPFVCIDDFLEPSFAEELAASYPTYSRATELGDTFQATNENLKVQICDYARFPEPAKRLADALSSPEFLQSVSHISGIPNLLWDKQFAGGGMHQTASSGHLDVHVDFNRTEDEGGNLFRRLNILVYLNPKWEEAWGGLLELWDRDVKRRHHALMPTHNRCVIFETSDISYHGVTPVRCPATAARKSFAAYYYTREAPPSYRSDHSTIFRARPNELLKGYVLMPADALRKSLAERYHGAKRKLKSLRRIS